MQSLINKLNELNNKILLFSFLCLIAFVPYLAARILVQLTQGRSPLLQTPVIVILFMVMFWWIYQITGSRAERLYNKSLFLFIPLVLGAFFFAFLPFAALSSLLMDRGFVTYEPAVPKGAFWIIQDLYFRQFFTELPFGDAIQAILPGTELRSEDPTAKFLLSLYQVFVAGQIISTSSAFIKVFNRSRK